MKKIIISLHTGALLLAGSVNANTTLIVENAVYTRL